MLALLRVVSEGWTRTTVSPNSTSQCERTEGSEELTLPLDSETWLENATPSKESLNG